MSYMASTLKETHVCLCWIPGYKGIQGNHKADTLARKGRSYNIPFRCDIDRYDFLPSLTSFYREQFINMWENQLQYKSATYKLCQSSFHPKSWFHKFNNLNRRHISPIQNQSEG